MVRPPRAKVVVEGLAIEQKEIDKAYIGDNVHIRVKGIGENDGHGRDLTKGLMAAATAGA
jgi:peptide chain release factor subunit 3